MKRKATKPAASGSAIDRVLQTAGKDRGHAPKCGSFMQFLTEHARVKMQDGNYGGYTFEGREPLREIVELIDRVMDAENPLPDATLGICGGAQLGKTILELNLQAYATGCRFLNTTLFLPDQDLVEGIVDTKLRPDVLDQIPWLNELISLGKMTNESGKTVHRKGAFNITDGDRVASGMLRGMNKVPTTFSADVVIEDEKDDIPPKNSKYLGGRMTASKLRFRLSIGTMRIEGAGQNEVFQAGTQHCWNLIARSGARVIPEERWPEVCRMAVDGSPKRDDPKLTPEGFRADDGRSWGYDPEALVYLADPDTGEVLDRRVGEWIAKFPERARQRRWTFRVSQLSLGAIDLIQIVRAYLTEAVLDPDSMKVFHCDRLAIPRGGGMQPITAEVLNRSRRVEEYDVGLTASEDPRAVRVAGLDMGDRCWFFARERRSALDVRMPWAEQLSAESVRTRVPRLFELLGLSCLFVDAGPLRDLSRDLCFALNGLLDFKPPHLDDPTRAVINFGNGLVWDGPTGRWTGLRCAAVEFTQRPGKGIEHKLGITQDGLFYPLIAANREESIERAVNDLLTPTENVIEIVDGKMRVDPRLRLPRKPQGAHPILQTLDDHLVTGSRKAPTEKGDLLFVDGVENHLLLAAAYAAMAEREATASVGISTFVPRAFPPRGSRASARRERSVLA